MTTFTDGPAAGVTLMIRRAPLFLRVAYHRYAEKWDALDQVGDEPTGAEDYTVYRLAEVKGRGHMRPGGCFVIAEYKVWPVQPDQAVMRNNEKWRAWATQQLEQEKNSDKAADQRPQSD